MRRPIYIATGALALSALVSSCSSPTKPSAHKPAHHGSAPAHVVTTQESPFGVQSTWVMAENAKAGTAAWHITSATGAPIVGYAGSTAATVGSNFELYVSTSAPQFHVEAYRMGWYGGTQARLVWTSPEVTGSSQPSCPLTPVVDMISCHWTPSMSIDVDSSWVQGDYLLKLVADPGQQSYVPLTVWDPASDATYVVDNSVFTWQAWNNYGGYDMYGGAPPGKSPSFNARARVDVLRPSLRQATAPTASSTPNAPGEPGGAVRARRHLLDRHDVQRQPEPDCQPQGLPVVGHDECWLPNNERSAAANGVSHGVNFVFFAASPILRHVRVQPGADGTPDRQMVDYREETADPIYATDPVEATGNTWDQAGLPASAIVGDTYGGYNINDPMVIVDAAAWPFQGTGLTNGEVLPHVIGSDFDGYDPAQHNPPDVQILAHSPIQTSDRMAWAHDADMTYHTDRTSKAGVMATGTNAWIGFLGPCQTAWSTNPCPVATPAVRAITLDILKVFGDGPAGLTHPSVGNAAAFPQR